MKTQTEIMRELLDRLFEADQSTLSPLQKYLAKFPDAVSDNKQQLIDALKDEARQGERFQWAIAKLSDGRYIQAFPSVINRFGLTPIQQGNQDNLL